MAGRKQKNSVDYFPHYCNHGGTILILERKYGIHGSGAWWKLLENLGKTEGHYIDCSNKTKWLLLQADTYFSDTELREFLDLLAELDAIDQPLWSSKNTVWCQKFVDGISDVYVNRKRDIPEKPNLNHHQQPISTPLNTISSGRNESDFKKQKSVVSKNDSYLDEKMGPTEKLNLNNKESISTPLNTISSGRNGDSINTQKPISTENNGISTENNAHDIIKIKPISTENNGISTGRNTQIKLNKIKLNKIKEINKETPKISFKDNVLLTQNEYDSLIKEHGKDDTDIKIDTLSDYKKSKGIKYKDDAATIRNWFRNDNKNNSKSKSSYFSGAGESDELKQKFKDVKVKTYNVDKNER